MGVRVTWVCVAGSEKEFSAAESGRVLTLVCGDEPAQRIPTAFVVPKDQEQFDRYYTFNNLFLWFYFHMEGVDLSQDSIYDVNRYFPDPDAAQLFIRDFEDVNRLNAEWVLRIANESGRRPVVLCEDSHPILVPSMVAERHPEAILRTFLHVPFPTPNALKNLPAWGRQWMVDVLFPALGANHLFGVQAPPFKKNLRDTLCSVGYRVDDYTYRTSSSAVTFLEHNPVGSDVRNVYELRDDPDVIAHQESILEEQRWGEYFERLQAGEVLGPGRVAEIQSRLKEGNILPSRLLGWSGRCEPVKGPDRAVIAFEREVMANPVAAAQWGLIMYVQAGRGRKLRLDRGADPYLEFRNDLVRLVQETNARLRSRCKGRDPIRLEFGSNRKYAMALLSVINGYICNGRDGYNLLLREAFIQKREDALIIVSRGAGAHHQLGPFGLSVGPDDLNELQEAYHTIIQADGRPQSEVTFRGKPIVRTYNGHTVQEVIESCDVVTWLNREIGGALDAAATISLLNEQVSLPLFFPARTVKGIASQYPIAGADLGVASPTDGLG